MLNPNLLEEGDMVLIDSRRLHHDQRIRALRLCSRERVRHQRLLGSFDEQLNHPAAPLPQLFCEVNHRPCGSTRPGHDIFNPRLFRVGLRPFHGSEEMIHIQRKAGRGKIPAKAADEMVISSAASTSPI